MGHIEGFPPISRADSRILILGSMPSRESLAQQQYYAHPRNAFWPIMCGFFAITAPDYPSRTEQVLRHGVAIWDVLKACFRTTSLDSDIDDRTIVTNDFPRFFSCHPGISRVYFNGAKAESVYLKHVKPKLPTVATPPALFRLPSASPAHAGMSLEQKKDAWRVILDEGLE